MIYSLCIKSNNQSNLSYLLESFENINLSNVYISKNKFKIYQNIIVHYSGDTPNVFFNYLAEILSNSIIEYYEPKMIKDLLNFNYFYFSDADKIQIQKACLDMLGTDEYKDRKNTIYLSLLKYVTFNKSIILDGFVHFRIKEYQEILDDACDLAVDNFLIEREYNEFVSLLKMYIQSKPSNISTVHMVYLNNDAYIFDNKYNLIPKNENILNAKYLSDISFSANDFALNTLLNLLPNKIIIHLVNKSDEFIHTLELIFEDHICFCDDCEFCKAYKKALSIHSSS